VSQAPPPPGRRHVYKQTGIKTQKYFNSIITETTKPQNPSNKYFKKKKLNANTCPSLRRRARVFLAAVAYVVLSVHYYGLARRQPQRRWEKGRSQQPPKRCRLREGDARRRDLVDNSLSALPHTHTHSHTHTQTHTHTHTQMHTQVMPAGIFFSSSQEQK